MWGIVVLRWSLLAASLVVWLVQPGPKAEGAQPKPAFDKVVLTSSGGITGRGSGKALTVDCQGKFTAKMRDKQRQGELKPEELAQLAKLVAAVDWKGVKAGYPGKGADFFQDDLAVTVAGKPHETHVSEAADRKDLTPALSELLDYLNKLHGQHKP